MLGFGRSYVALQRICGSVCVVILEATGMLQFIDKFKPLEMSKGKFLDKA